MSRVAALLAVAALAACASHDGSAADAAADLTFVVPSCVPVTYQATGDSFCTSRCQVLTPTVKNALAFAVAGGNVYWMDSPSVCTDGGMGYDTQILAVPTSGGTPAVVHAIGPALLASPTMVADPTNLYWAEVVQKPLEQDLTLYRMPLGGGEATALYTATASGGATPSNLALAGTSLYYVFGGALLGIPLAGGAPKNLATGLHATWIAAGPRGLYWPDSVATDAGPSLGAVMTLPLDGGTPAPLIQNIPVKYTGYHLLADASAVYWSSTGIGMGGAVLEVPLDHPHLVVLDEPVNIGVALLDATGLYGGRFMPSGFVRVPLDGSSPVTLFSDNNLLLLAGLDDTSVYAWAGSAIVRVPKQ